MHPQKKFVRLYREWQSVVVLYRRLRGLSICDLIGSFLPQALTQSNFRANLHYDLPIIVLFLFYSFSFSCFFVFYYGSSFSLFLPLVLLFRSIPSLLAAVASPFVFGPRPGYSFRYTFEPFGLFPACQVPQTNPNPKTLMPRQYVPDTALGKRTHAWQMTLPSPRRSAWCRSPLMMPRARKVAITTQSVPTDLPWTSSTRQPIHCTSARPSTNHRRNRPPKWPVSSKRCTKPALSCAISPILCH